jgi:HK97 family phage major capsid protein
MTKKGESSMTVKELLEKRATIWDQAQALLQKARDEKRALNADEQQQFDRMVAEMGELKATADREERAAQIDAEMRKSVTDPVRPAAGTPEARAAERNEEYRSAMDAYLRKGAQELTHEQRTVLAERRAMSQVTGNLGGYTIMDKSFGRLIEELKSFGGIRQSRAEFLTTSSGENMPIPIGDDTNNKGRRLGAGDTAATNKDPAFAQRNLETFLYTSEIVKAPFQLLQDSMFDIEGWLWNKLAERISRITNEEQTTGDGNGMPLGIVTGAGEGKVAPGGQVDSITYNDLVDMFLSVDAAHRQNAEWMFNDNTLKALMKLADQDGKPLWVPSLVAGIPDMVLGKRYVINTDMADPGAGNKPLLFGNLNLYKGRDVTGAIIKRLEEKYIEEGMVGFVMFSRHGGTLASIGKAVKYFKNPAA